MQRFPCGQKFPPDREHVDEADHGVDQAKLGHLEHGERLVGDAIGSEDVLGCTIDD